MRTATAVHDEAGRKAQQRRERAWEDELTLSLAMGTQALAYGALYILPAASTAAWWAVLLLLLPMGLMRALAWAVSRTAPENAAASLPWRAASMGLAALFFSNMAVCLLTLTELTHVFFFPGASRLTLALAAALALGLGIPASPDAAPNAVRFLRWFLLAAFGFCAVTVLPSAEAGYLFPPAGFGAGHTLRCAAMGAGSVWMAGAAAVLTPDRKPARRLTAALPGAAVILLVSALFLCCACVLPGTRLNFSRGYALRLQLLTEMSPNTLSWSLMLMGEMLLFLAGFAVCADLMRKSLQSACGVSRIPVLPFALLCVPPAVAGASACEEALTRLLPWRWPAAAGLLLLCLIGNLRGKRKGRTA